MVKIRIASPSSRYERKRAKRLRYTKQHSWFAWRPVRVGDYIFWLEWVVRRDKGYSCSIYDDPYQWVYEDPVAVIAEKLKEKK